MRGMEASCYPLNNNMPLTSYAFSFERIALKRATWPASYADFPPYPCRTLQRGFVAAVAQVG